MPPYKPITELPSWVPRLALEDANLMTEKQQLRLQVGFAATTDEKDVEQDAEQGVGKGREHGPASSHIVGSHALAADRTFRNPACTMCQAEPINQG